METLTIGELANKAEINPSAIRYYESIGLMPKVERINGQRRYTADVLDRLKFIKTAQLAGFQIGEISVLLEGFENSVPPSERWQRMAQKKTNELIESLFGSILLNYINLSKRTTLILYFLIYQKGQP
jgi:MerR family redox-sensitive transcriptional activator SoxR